MLTGGDECGETKATTAVAIEGTCWWVGEEEDGETVDFGLVGLLDSFGVEFVAKKKLDFNEHFSAI